MRLSEITLYTVLRQQRNSCHAYPTWCYECIDDIEIMIDVINFSKYNKQVSYSQGP